MWSNELPHIYYPFPVPMENPLNCAWDGSRLCWIPRPATAIWLQGDRSTKWRCWYFPWWRSLSQRSLRSSTSPPHHTMSTLMIFHLGCYHHQKLMTIETPHCVFVRRRRVIGLRSCHANGRYRVERWWGEEVWRGRGSLQVGGYPRSRHVSPIRGTNNLGASDVGRN